MTRRQHFNTIKNLTAATLWLHFWVGFGNSRIRGAADEEQWYRKGKTKTIDMHKKCESCACVEEGVCRVLHVCCGAVGNKAVSTGALPVIAHLGTHRQLKGKSTK
jgi:hypothetical protein